MKKILCALLGILLAGTSWSATLPAGYTELQYIESTGTQYIDPGINITSANISTLKTEAIISNVSPESGSISGYSNNSVGKLWYGLSAVSPYNFYYSNGQTEAKFSQTGSVQFYKYIIDAPSGSYKVYTESNDLIASKTGLTYSTTHNYKFYLFTYYPERSTAFQPQKIKYAKFWFDGALVRDLIPAQNSSGVIGMYDTVSGTFFTNQGTGTFTAGPEVPIRIATTAYNSARFSPVVTELNDTIATIRSVVTNTINQTKAIADLQATKQTRPDETCPAGKKCLLVEDDAGQPHWYEIIESANRLPAGYTELEYIESTGTQYIDTGYPVNNNVSAKMKIMRTAADGNSALFGYRFVQTASAVGNMRFVFLYADNKVGLRTGVNTTNSTQSISLNQDYVIEYALDSIKVNNVKWVSSSESYSTTSFGNGYLFSTNTEGYASSDINNFVGRIYYFEEMDNGNLVRNLIPAKNASGVIGMYDTVSGTFFTNKGSGTFVAGPEI